MTPDDLSKILDAATPGPWHHGPESHNVRTAGRYCPGGFRISCENGVGDHSEDAALIVALRNLAPALLRLWRAAEQVASGDTPAKWEEFYAALAALRKLEEHKP